MTFEFFRKWLPWIQKLQCYFHKTFIYVISTLFFNNPIKKLIFWLKGSMYLKFTSFSKFTPPTQGLSDRRDFGYIGRCPICFMQNISHQPSDSGGEVI